MDNISSSTCVDRLDRECKLSDIPPTKDRTSGIFPRYIPQMAKLGDETSMRGIEQIPGPTTIVEAKKGSGAASK